MKTNDTKHPLTQALEDAGVRLLIESRPTSLTTDKEGWKHFSWSVRILCGGRETSLITYKMGAAHVIKGAALAWNKPLPKAPKAEDVIYSMVLDSSSGGESFSDWCSNFGYEEDSRKALETYLACQESGRNLRKVLGAHSRAVVEASQDW